MQPQHVSSAPKSPKAHNAHWSDWCSSRVRPVPTGSVLCCSHARFGLLSWLCGSAKKSNGFVLNRNPMDLVWPPCQSQSLLGPHGHPGLVFALRLNQVTVHDFVLLFLPPSGPHLIPRTIGSLKPSQLVSPHWEDHWHRPFALVLNMHQH
jgi:hypothetical protein